MNATLTSSSRISRTRWGKRTFDLAFAGFGLIVTAPLWVLIPLCIWGEDRGPIFFKDPRVGKGGDVFLLLKFRTMIHGADEHYGKLQARPNDFRVTKVGQILRATALDELPQLLNILRGEMSVVGPRPLRADEEEVCQQGKESPADFQKRHVVRPGLTGLAQIYTARTASRSKKLAYDLQYIERQNIFLDVKLVLLSILRTLLARWES